MTPLLTLLAILGTLAIGAMSPGPSFVLVVRTAVAQSRRDGLATALGMGVGGVIFAGLALAGLQTVLAQAAWLYIGLKIAGGLYLVYLGVMLWRAAKQPLEMGAAGETASGRPGKSFLLGLATQVSNPKAAVFYGSIFAALLPQQSELWLILALPPLVFAVEAGWYIIVALLFSSTRPRGVYLHSKRWIDRAAGAVLGALGLRLVFEAARPA
jgi:RhtB (resistance to homoserine/threonine) family protein